MKYIDTEKLIAKIEELDDEYRTLRINGTTQEAKEADLVVHVLHGISNFIDSLQKDETQVDRMLCSQIWWEEQGWIMIPPNVTLKGIESLLERVRHKIKWNKENGIEEQERPEVDLENYLENYFKGWHVEEEIGLTKPDGWSCIVVDLKDIARDFYELGRARKEK